MPLAHIVAVLLLAYAPADKLEVVKTGSLNVYRAADDAPVLVMVSLYRGDELVRTRELRRYQPPIGTVLGVPSSVVRDRAEVTWKNLPEGEYAIVFEAKGYIRSSKRVRVSHEDGDELEILVELEKEKGAGKKSRDRR
jgi:hypothetical protein